MLFWAVAGGGWISVAHGLIARFAGRLLRPLLTIAKRKIFLACACVGAAYIGYMYLDYQRRHFTVDHSEFEPRLRELLAEKALLHGYSPFTYAPEVTKILNIVRTCVNISQAEIDAAYRAHDYLIRFYKPKYDDCGGAKDVSPPQRVVPIYIVGTLLYASIKDNRYVDKSIPDDDNILGFDLSVMWGNWLRNDFIIGDALVRRASP